MSDGISAKFKWEGLTKKRILESAQKQFRQEFARVVVPLIQDQVARGTSPVKGKRRFPKYSAMYKGAMKEGPIEGTDGAKYTKTQSPVNLFVSGDTMRSLKARATNDGIEITFTKTLNGENIAAAHNEGRGRLPKRRLLPTNPGEEFERKIEKPMRIIATDALRTAIKKESDF